MKALLLINLGTPDAPEKKDVKRYLTEFLNDGRVIDFPALKRKLLVNGIIVPFRASASTLAYKELWTEKGSPLQFHTAALAGKVQKELEGQYEVFYAMRYQNPSLDEVLAKIEQKVFSELVVVPLYPQYASSTTGSTAQRVMEIVGKWEVIPSMRFVNTFHENEAFIRAIVAQGDKHDIQSYDRILFSYHGLPERHIKKSCKVPGCKPEDCISSNEEQRKYCYRSACYETTRRVVKYLQIPEDKYGVVFQSRLGKDPWLQPYAEPTIIELAKQGYKRLLVFSPAFVADCLETVVEIGSEYQEVFEENGGEHIQLVESLNSSSLWVKAVKDIVLNPV